jgi:hypothetical protein
LPLLFSKLTYSSTAFSTSHLKPDSPKFAFHQLMNLLRDTFTNNAKLTAGIMEVKMTFTGKEKARMRYRLKKNIGIKISRRFH